MIATRNVLLGEAFEVTIAGIQRHGSGRDVIISGTVSSKYVVEKAADVAGGYVEKKENVVNLLKVQEGVASNQVMLRVRFAEVSRSAVQELGASYFLNKTNWAGRVVPPGVPAPVFDTDKGGLVFGGDSAHTPPIGPGEIQVAAGKRDN